MAIDYDEAQPFLRTYARLLFKIFPHLGRSQKEVVTVQVRRLQKYAIVNCFPERGEDGIRRYQMDDLPWLRGLPHADSGYAEYAGFAWANAHPTARFIGFETKPEWDPVFGSLLLVD